MAYAPHQGARSAVRQTVAGFVLEEPAHMGLFDLFKSKGDDKPKASPAAKWANVASDKRAQNYDRQEALQALADMGTADAVAALLAGEPLSPLLAPLGPARLDTPAATS